MTTNRDRPAEVSAPTSGVTPAGGNARAAGLAVLLISADLDELIGMSDSLKVILRGRIVGDADPHSVTPEALGSMMTGAGPEAGAA